MNERQLKLLKVTLHILDLLSQYDLILKHEDKKELLELLQYDWVKQDLWVLVDDLQIEFWIDIS